MPHAGQVIGGKYLLREEIGEGTRGTVWKSVHNSLGRPFAVKFLKREGPNTDVAELRFMREAQLAAAIQHRFVVDIVDFGAAEDGTPYMVMEFLQGESLATRLARGPDLTVRELVRLVGQSLVGLEAVHQAGIIHRDVKPENIMLVAEAGGVIPKLVDFGISRIENASSRRDGRITDPHIALGSPWYMSPEQAQGSADIDRRTDIYSMGVILYEGLCGAVPYDDDDHLRLLGKVSRGGAEPMRTARGDVGVELATVVDRAMAAKPEQRFTLAAEMAAALFDSNDTLSQGLTCPARASRPAPSAPEPRHVVPTESEISREMLAASPILASLPRRTRRPAAVVISFAAGIALGWLLQFLSPPPETVYVEVPGPAPAAVSAPVAPTPGKPAEEPPPAVKKKRRATRVAGR